MFTLKNRSANNVILMKRVQQYQAASVAVLAGWLTDHPDEETRWRLVAEFLEEYRREPPVVRLALLSPEPSSVGDPHWDVFLAALAEHLAAKDGHAGPPGLNHGDSASSGSRSTPPQPASTRSSTHRPHSVAVESSSTPRSWKSHERCASA
ncbi:hypothetical protein [Streptosporangium canum]|uniref:hypothetical protein n=1 Tax=Streptosporangium canum TaxID=324952 RepID=UPI00379ED516